MSTYFVRLTALSILFWSYSHALQARDMEEITVTADPLSDNGNRLIQPVSVINKRELNRKNVQNIGETVATELGVSAADFGAGASKPVIRGLGGARIRVLENGLGTMDASVASDDHAITSDPLNADQIEILRGPSTLLYGSGASGGLINIVNNKIPKQVPERPAGEALTQVDTAADGFTGAGRLELGMKNFALHFDGLTRDLDDYGIPGHAELEEEDDDDEHADESGTLENSALEATAGSIGVSVTGARFFLGGSISTLDSEYGIPGHHHEDDDDEEGVLLDTEQTRYDFEAVVNDPVPGLQEIATHWRYGDYRHMEFEGDEIGTRFDNEELEGRLELIHAPLRDWRGVVGAHFHRRDFSAEGEEAFITPSERTSTAFFVLEKADYGDWHYETGLRYEHIESENAAGDREHDVFSGSGGVHWHYTGDQALGLAIIWSQRGPALEELFANGPHLANNAFERGNQQLRDETSTNVELSWLREGEWFDFSSHLFYNRIDNFIYPQAGDRNGDGNADRVEEDFTGALSDIQDEGLLLLDYQQRDAEFIGFELEGVFTLFDDQRGAAGLRLWTDYVKGELSGGENLPRIPPWRAGANLTFERKPWSMALDYTYTDDQNDVAPLETRTPGYDILNLYADYDVHRANVTFNVFAKFTNVLDQEIRRHTSLVKNIAPLPGRSVTLGIRASF